LLGASLIDRYHDLNDLRTLSQQPKIRWADFAAQRFLRLDRIARPVLGPSDCEPATDRNELDLNLEVSFALIGKGQIEPAGLVGLHQGDRQLIRSLHV